MIDWSQLGLGIAALVVLFYVLLWNGKQQEKRDERQAKRYADLLEKYATLTVSVLDVVRENTRAITLMEEGTKGLPAFVQQVDERLRAGQSKFEDHDLRLGRLEGRGGG